MPGKAETKKRKRGESRRGSGAGSARGKGKGKGKGKGQSKKAQRRRDRSIGNVERDKGGRPSEGGSGDHRTDDDALGLYSDIPPVDGRDLRNRMHHRMVRHPFFHLALFLLLPL